MPELSIRKIIEKTLSGEIRIPSFQRGFVWEPEKVAFFIDSLYKGYPIGSLLFWRTNIRLENERQLGNYSLPEPTKRISFRLCFGWSAKNYFYLFCLSDRTYCCFNRIKLDGYLLYFGKFS